MLYNTKLHEIECGQLNFFQKQTFYRGDVQSDLRSGGGK